ncbi:MAG TPA: cytochrome c oxidase subunit II [Caulobacteraceae bacterium]|jgi:cytochrome c oxidase subunit 2
MRLGRAAALILLLGLAGCQGFQTTLEPQGYQAERIDVIWRLMLVICGVMYLLVLGFLAWAMWRARRRLGFEPVDPNQSHDRKLQTTLAGWAGLIVLGLSVLTAATFLVDRQLAHAAAQNAQHIRVTANQFWWKIEYLETDPSQNVTTANELHLPVGRAAMIELRSNDVIHSFWIPNLAGKQDLIPGRKGEAVITPRRAGRYRGQCAEFCGLQHAHMALHVTAESPAQFAAWKAHQLQPALQPADALRVQGQQVFESGACGACHQIAGTEAGGQVGPTLTHVASRPSLAAGTLPYSRGSLAAWIADPQGIKPGTNMPAVSLSSSDLNALVAYLDSLK